MQLQTDKNYSLLFFNEQKWLMWANCYGVRESIQFCMCYYNKTVTLLSYSSILNLFSIPNCKADSVCDGQKISIFKHQICGGNSLNGACQLCHHIDFIDTKLCFQLC